MKDDSKMLSKFFSEKELRCPCCELCNVDKVLLIKMDNLRLKLDRPLIITSCCRCKKHNEEEGGAKSSAHITTPLKPSMAMDIYAPTVEERGEIMQAALSLGFRGFGFYEDHIHLDIGRVKVSAWGKKADKIKKPSQKK